MSYVLTVIHPPADGAAFGKAEQLEPVRYHARAAKTQAVHALFTHGVSKDNAKAFGYSLWMTDEGTPLRHGGTGLTFRIDPANNAPHPCPCDGCGRLVLPTDHAQAHHEDAYCLGCFAWSHSDVGCLPANTAHSAKETP